VLLMTDGTGNQIPMRCTIFRNQLGCIAVAISTERNFGTLLKTDLQWQMSLVANRTIAVERILIMPEMAAEAGRNADMAPVTSNTIAIVGTHL
jgi:hypothetical protein